MPRDDPTGELTRGAVSTRQLRPTDAKRLHREWRRRTEGRLSLIVESVTQPFNLGSILRTAAAFGAQRVWLTGNTADPSHPHVGKVALGSQRRLELRRDDTASAVAAAHADGLRVVAVELTGDALPLHEAPLAGDVCLAVGGEDHGCSPLLLASADAAAYIPQVGRVGSLNVAVAAAVAIAETRRREWQDSGGAHAGS